MPTNTIDFKDFVQHNFYGNLNDGKNTKNLMGTDKKAYFAICDADYTAKFTSLGKDFKITYDESTDQVTSTYYEMDTKKGKVIVSKNPVVMALNEFVKDAGQIITDLFHSEKVEKDLQIKK